MTKKPKPDGRARTHETRLAQSRLDMDDAERLEADSVQLAARQESSVAEQAQNPQKIEVSPAEPRKTKAAKAPEMAVEQGRADSAPTPAPKAEKPTRASLGRFGAGNMPVLRRRSRRTFRSRKANFNSFALVWGDHENAKTNQTGRKASLAQASQAVEHDFRGAYRISRVEGVSFR
jgi:hypothetical protein